MGFHVDYDALFLLSQDINHDASEISEGINNLRGSINRISSSGNISGIGADSIFFYFNCFHGVILSSLSNLLKLHADNCRIYTSDYLGYIDQATHTVIDEQELTDIHSELNSCEMNAEAVFEQTRKTVSDISDLLAVNIPQSIVVEQYCEAVCTDVHKLISNIDSLEDIHSDKDFEETSAMISALSAYINERLGTGRAFVEEFSPEKMVESRSFQMLLQTSIAVEKQIKNKIDLLNQANQLESQRIQRLDAESREKFAKIEKIAVVGLCTIISAGAIVLTGGAATPLVVGTVSAISGAVIAGNNTAMNQYTESGSVNNWLEVAGDAAIGGVTGFISGYTGAKLGGFITQQGKNCLSPLLNSQNIAVRVGSYGVIGATSEVTTGIVTRGASTFTVTMVTSDGDVQRAAEDAKEDALDKDQILKDAAIGGVTGGVQGIRKPIEFPDIPDGEFEPNDSFTKNGTKYRADDNGDVYQFYDSEKKIWKNFPGKKYVSQGYTYKTDERGNIISVEGDLHLSDEERKSLNAKLDDMQYMDDRGHIIADRFGGSNLSDNLFAQNSKVNRGDYKKLENDFAEILENGGQVHSEYKLLYSGSSTRPSGIEVRYTTITADGIPHSGTKIFDNP